jgi:hypothetical protein
MYGIYLWQNNACHKVQKFAYIFKKIGLWMRFLGNVFSKWYWYTSIEYMVI